MDPESLQIGIVFIASLVCITVLLFLIMQCFMREKTYEEVLEEQRKRMNLDQTSKANKGEKKEKKKKQKKGKGEKTEEQKAVQPEVAKMVELEIDPVIIEPSKDQAKHKSPKGKSHKTDKPILKNKDEKSLVREASAEETFHPPTLAKDVVELKYDKERKQKSSESELRERKSKKKEVEEPIVMAKQASKENTPPPPEGKKTKGKDTSKLAEPAITNAGAQLISTMKATTLNTPEINALMEVLMQRQGSGEWNKKLQKGDSSLLAKKQLEEKEKALREEQQRAESSANKLHQVRADLANERQKFLSLEKQSKDHQAQHQSEINAMSTRIRQIHEQHNGEMNQLRMQLKHTKLQDQTALIQQLTQENQKLKENASGAHEQSQQMRILQEELSKNVAKLNSSEGIKKSLENKIAMYEEKLRNMQRDTDGHLKGKLNEVTQELKRAEGRNADLQRDLERSKAATSQAEQEVSNARNKMKTIESSSDDKLKTVEEKLKESEKHKDDVETKVRTIEKKLADVERENKKKESELKKLRDENSTLSAEMKNMLERTSGEGQEAPVPPVTEVKDVEHKEATKLREELNKHAAKVEELTKDLEAQRKKNNELREKNWKAVEALNNAEKAAQSSQSQGLEEAKQKLTKEKEDIVAALERLFPNISIEHVKASWVNTFESAASEHLQKSSNAESLAQESAQQQSKLEAQVQHYKTVLADTESILNKLQSSVESEERKWQQQLKLAEEETKQSKEKINRLESEIQKLQDSAQDTSLSDLESKLDALRKENEKLQERLQKEADSFKEQLEEERKSKKELASANVRLNGMLKTGQDALKAEQDLVKKLQNQLQDKSKSLANGSAPQELEELKKKLASTQKQLERETQYSRQLKQKLAASVEKDRGTSV